MNNNPLNDVHTLSHTTWTCKYHNCCAGKLSLKLSPLGRLRKNHQLGWWIFIVLFSYVGEARLLYAISFHGFRKHGKRTYPYALFSI